MWVSVKSALDAARERQLRGSGLVLDVLNQIDLPSQTLHLPSAQGKCDHGLVKPHTHTLSAILTAYQRKRDARRDTR